MDRTRSHQNCTAEDHSIPTFAKRGTRWRAQVRRQGHEPLSKTFATKAEAAAWAREVETRIDRGERIDANRRITFTDLYEAYKREMLSRKAASRSKDQALKAIDALLGEKRLVELKAPAILKFCRDRESQGAGPATILMDLSYIGTILRHGGAVLNAETAAAQALSALASARGALRHAGRVARPEERDRRPNDAELKKLIELWAQKPRQSIPMIDLMLFAVSTAMRLGEIVGIEWQDLDEVKRTIIIRERKHPTAKKSNDQTVPLLLGPFQFDGQRIDPLEIILRQPSAWRREGRIFPHAAASISTAFTRGVEEANIPDLHFHDLRHDGASRLFEAGYPIEQVALVTGHRDWNMLRRYTQLKAADLHRSPMIAPTESPGE